MFISVRTHTQTQTHTRMCYYHIIELISKLLSGDYDQMMNVLWLRSKRTCDSYLSAHYNNNYDLVFIQDVSLLDTILAICKFSF
jgi:hypothetical protein